MTAPWTQQLGATSLGTAYLTVEDSYDELDLSELFNDTFSNGVSGASEVIITINNSTLSGEMIVIDLLLAGTDWPVGVTSIRLLVSGYVVAYLNNSGLTGTSQVFPGGHLGLAYELTISSGTDVSVLTQAQSAGVPTTSRIALFVNITGNVTHLSWGVGWGAGSIFRLINEATIYGKGGAGGAGVSGSGNGAAGGNALELNGNEVTIDNEDGNIWGGGGGGGGGGILNQLFGVGGGFSEFGFHSNGGGGGGGAGGVATSGGTATGAWTLNGGNIVGFSGTNTGVAVYDTTELVMRIDSAGITSGTFSGVQITALSAAGSSGGTGGAGVGGIGSHTVATDGVNPDIKQGDGGNGGAGGTFGTAGSNGAVASPPTVAPGTGGAAGKAIDLGGGSVTWLSGNNASQVKGAVS